MTAPILSLCMIVRDSATTLPACLEGIRPWVDEIIVVDTGSLDNTREIARAYGAKVVEFPWIDDFSAARNVSLAAAQGKWLFWMDSDDTIDAENGRKLRELAYTEHPPEVLGFSMRVHCPTRHFASTGDITAVDHIKLVRNHPQIRFERRIHEQLLASIKRLGGTWLFTDIFVVHSGSDTTPAGRVRKTERDLRILALEYAENPSDPFTLFNLGMTYNDIEQHEVAIPYLQRCLEVLHPGDSIVGKAHAILAACCMQMEKYEEARQVCSQGLVLEPDDAELLFRLGLAEHSLRRPGEAIDAYRRALRPQTARRFQSVEIGLSSYLSRHNLAAVYADLGRDDLAEVEYRRIIADEPQYRPAYLLLGHSLIRQRRFTSLELEIEAHAHNSRLECELAAMRASLAAARDQLPQAKEQFEKAVAADPTSVEARRDQCELLFHRGNFQETAEALLLLEGLAPKDPSVPLRLAILYSNYGRPQEALEAVQRAIVRRPDFEAAKTLKNQLLAKCSGTATEN